MESSHSFELHQDMKTRLDNKLFGLLMLFKKMIASFSENRVLNFLPNLNTAIISSASENTNRKVRKF